MPLMILLIIGVLLYNMPMAFLGLGAVAIGVTASVLASSVIFRLIGHPTQS
jgi:hypothetical protein